MCIYCQFTTRYYSLNPLPLRIGIVAGEASGDILGAGLIKALKQQYPNAVFEGIAGPLMEQQGCQALFAMEELSVMGLVEVLGRLRRLIDVRKQLVAHFKANPPDAFIGIDAPDFNLGLELKLKQLGIKTIHYVSPSVWAWRQKRIFKIAAATDMVLCLLPFEGDIYNRYQVPNVFVGHTLADDIPLHTDTAQARTDLGLAVDDKVLAVMPGSRGSELAMLTEPFFAAVQLLRQSYPDLKVLIPVVNDKRKAQLLAIKKRVAPDLAIIVVDGQSRTVMTAADAILMASGTATLEATLLKKPMVVAYKLKWLSYQIFSRLININYFSLPNLLAGKALVPEVLQNQVNGENLSALLLPYLAGDTEHLAQAFEQIHLQLRCNASEKAAQVVLAIIAGQQPGRAWLANSEQ